MNADDRLAMIETLLRAMFDAQRNYGCGFYGSSEWLAAYEQLAKEVGADPYGEADE